MTQRKAPDKPSQQPGEEPEREKIPTLTQAESFSEDSFDLDSLDIPILTDLIDQTGVESDPRSTLENSPEADSGDTAGVSALKTGDDKH